MEDPPKQECPGEEYEDERAECPSPDGVAPGLIPNFDEREPNLHPEHGFNLRDGPSSNWFPVLVFIDEKILPNYHHETILRLGSGKFAELHTTAQIQCGEGFSSSVIIQLRIQDSNIRHSVATLHIPFADLTANPEIRDLSVEEDDNVKTIFKDIHCTTKSDLRPGITKNDSDTLALSQCNPEDGTVQRLAKLHSTIRRLRLDVDMANVRRTVGENFTDKGTSGIAAVDAIGRAIIKVLGDGNVIHLLFREEASFKDNWQPKIENARNEKSPFKQFLKNAAGQYKELEFDNFTLPKEKPDKRIPPHVVFLSEQQRAVELIGGPVEETEKRRGQRDALSEMDLKIAVVADKFSTWQKSPDDLETYGVRADATPTHQYFLISCAEGVGQLLPSVGETCKFYLGELPRRKAPIMQFSDDYIDKTLTEIMGLVAETVENFNHDVMRANRPRLESMDRFRFGLAEILMPYLPGPSDEVIADNLELSDIALTCKTALDLAGQLMSESDLQGSATINSEQLRDAIRTWLRSNGGIYRPHESGRGEPWTGRRIQLPPGTAADIAMFSVMTPSQIGWPKNYKAPPVKANLPSLAIVGALDLFLKTIGNALLADGKYTIQGIERTLKTVTGRMYYTPNETTAEAECFAINTMNNLPKAAMANAIWKYALDFQDKFRPNPINLLSAFPELQEAMSKMPQEDEHTLAIQSLSNDICGYAFVNGGPGTGKSRLGLVISQALVHAGKKIAWICPSNELVVDAVDRFRKIMPKTEANRMMIWDAEIAGMTSLGRDVNLIGMEGNATRAEQDLAVRVNRIRTATNREKNAGAYPLSMSAYAKRLAVGRHSLWPEYPEYLEQLRRDDDTLRDNFVTNNERARAQLKDALRRSDVVVCTPVTFLQATSHDDSYEPDLIIVDEANRLSEPQSWIPVAKRPNTPIIYFGDNQQSPPMATMKDDKDYLTWFGEQQAISLFRRVYRAKQMSTTLLRNFRAQGPVADWAAKYFYKGSLRIIHRAGTEVSHMSRDWFKTQLGLDRPASNFLIEIQAAQEEPVGNSFTNPVNAQWGVMFLRYILRNAPLTNGIDALNKVNPPRVGSILIIVMYAAQKLEWQGHLARLSVAEGRMTEISVRTVNDSSSHEADYVICDLVRTKKPGFTSMAYRIVVAATRARVMTIYLGNRRAMNQSHTLNDLRQHIERRRGLVVIRRSKITWNTTCSRCSRLGHWARECDQKLSCSICKELKLPAGHSLANCKQALHGEYPVDWSGKVADDGADLNPWSFDDKPKANGVQGDGTGRQKFGKNQRSFITMPKPPQARSQFEGVMRRLHGKRVGSASIVTKMPVTKVPVATQDDSKTAETLEAVNNEEAVADDAGKDSWGTPADDAGKDSWGTPANDAGQNSGNIVPTIEATSAENAEQEAKVDNVGPDFW